jgi:uncharacterized protein (TIGR00290 family)
LNESGVYTGGGITSAQSENNQPNPAPKRILLSWSGGKDSAWALHLLRRENKYEVVALLTTINEKFRRVAIHGFREELLDRQAASVGLPLWKVDLPFPCSNADYESRMAQVCARASAEGLYGIAFGDLFLEDIRAYREARLTAAGKSALFPMWGRDTSAVARDFIAAGFQAFIVCLDPRALDASFAGRRYDEQLLADLPANVDPCGENGEFHTFVHAGPIFAEPIACETGEVVEREDFVFCDLTPT